MRMVTVSNRLPIVIEPEGDGWTVRPGAGGLVTALAPILRRWGGVWIGWSGVGESAGADIGGLLAEYGRSEGYELKGVSLTPEECQGFYQGYSNEIIWPLFHDLQSRCNFVPDYWTVYLAVKQKFGDVTVETIKPDDFIWVQDYHLMGLGRVLRERRVANKIGFFLHIPFPPPDIFCKLPWREDVLNGLLSYDLVGFQTPRDLENFSDCARKLVPRARRQHRGGMLRVTCGGRTCTLGAFPIGIDYAEWARGAASPSVSQRARQLREEMQGLQILFGVDRLDYTKGVPYRLKAFRLALQRFPDLHRAVTLLQVVVPSRQDVPEYQDLKAEIERLVTQINGEFTQPGWVPIHHVFRSISREELMAYYRLADVALVTPLKDGMNLVAKEYCACQVDGNGVLILSEFAGAAEQLKRDAVMVNPYDLDRVAEAIHKAVGMTKTQRRPAMRRLRRCIEKEDIYWWLNRYLKACGVAPPGEAAAAPAKITSPAEAPKPVVEISGL